MQLPYTALYAVATPALSIIRSIEPSCSAVQLNGLVPFVGGAEDEGRIIFRVPSGSTR